MRSYADYSNKDALAIALNKYLQDNQTILINVPELKEYWTHASSTSPARTSPVKKAVGVDVTPAPKKVAPAGRKATPGTTRRRQTQPKKEEVEVT